MPSQKSTARETVLPSRRRGHARVAAIMDAAASVFATRGFGGATMTEIAAASGTAIGSLYRFFPTKHLLADALLARYAATFDSRLDALRSEVPSLSPGQLAEQLLQLIDRRDPDRDAALVLTETDPNGAVARARLRSGFRAGIAAVLEAAGLPPARAASMAPVVAQVMKALPTLEREGLGDEAVVAELRLMLGSYLAVTLAGSTSADAKPSPSSARTRGTTSPA